MFTFLALVMPYKRLHFIFAVIAGLVGYGRIYLSQHFITDVYTGMIIGVIVTTVIYRLTYEKSFFTKE
jgi:membrane-associated phospholipid phosphatase